MVKKGIWILALLTFLFIGLSRIIGISQGSFEMIAAQVAYPFLRVQDFFSRSIDRWHTQQKVLAELEALALERDSLLQELISLKAVKQYADATRYLADFMKRYSPSTMIIAPILLRNFEGTYFFFIDAGEQSGIKPGMIALYYQNLIGKVTDVYPSYSKVLLIIDPHCPVAAYCSHGVQGICRGFKQSLMIFEYVDYNAVVQQGDMLFSSGEGGLFPRGFALGTITHTEGVGYSRSIIIKPLIDFKKISYCTIVPHTISSNSEEKARNVAFL